MIVNKFAEVALLRFKRAFPCLYKYDGKSLLITNITENLRFLSSYKTDDGAQGGTNDGYYI